MEDTEFGNLPDTYTNPVGDNLLTDEQVLEYLYGSQFDPESPDNSAYDGSTNTNTGSGNWLSDLLNGAKSLPNWQRALLSAGLGSLLNRASGGSGLFTPPPVQKVGFQGTIPEYTATRTQTPDYVQRPTDFRVKLDPKTNTYGYDVVPYRPGQGGISYFTPMQYTKVAPAPAASPAPGTTTPTTPTQEKALAGGGVVSLQDGGFVVPARVVSEIGNGSTDGGIAAIQGRIPGTRALRGPGDGVSDNIPARLASGGEARVANGEAYIPAEAVARVGGGDHKRGTNALYQMLDRVERASKTAKRGQDSRARNFIPGAK